MTIFAAKMRDLRDSLRDLRTLQQIASNSTSACVDGRESLSDAVNGVADALADPIKGHIELYSVFRDYLKHEDDLINNRLNWNFTIQGFLFTAYTFTLQKL